MIRRKRSYRRYQMGGYPGDEDLYGLSQGFVGATQLAEPLLPHSVDEYGYQKGIVGRSVLRGAGSGAAAGTAILPGVGTLVGAGVGAIAGLIGGKKKKDEALQARQEAYNTHSNLLSRAGTARLIGYNTTGGIGNSLYALGGNLHKLASDISEVEGRTHAEGGVKFPAEGVELEDNETVSGDYVFSDVLGFADRHKKIARQIGKIEKKPINTERRTTLEILRKKENALKHEQEDVKSYLGENIGKYLYGGNLKRYQMGGITIPAYTIPEGNPIVAADPSKQFNSESDHINYYRRLALERLSADDRALYDNTLSDSNYNEIDRLNRADAIIALRGGLPAYTKPSSVSPGLINREDGMSYGILPSRKIRLNYQPERNKLGYRTKNGIPKTRLIR